MHPRQRDLHEPAYADVFIAPGQSVSKSLTVSMSNAAEDACQQATFTLDYTATARSSA